MLCPGFQATQKIATIQLNSGIIWKIPPEAMISIGLSGAMPWLPCRHIARVPFGQQGTP